MAAVTLGSGSRRRECTDTGWLPHGNCMRGSSRILGARVSDAAAEAITRAPIALLGSVFAIPGGPATALSAARVIGRNWPIAVLVVLIGGLFWPTRNTADEEELAIRLRPNGPDADIRKCN
jgi:hypothetical protein